MDVSNISAANTKFGVDLFQRLSSAQKNQNIFFSPFSISVALAMTQLGARENTAAEMAAALKWGVSDESVIHKEYQKYLTKLQTPTDKYQLSTANRIYVEKSFSILDEFLKNTKDFYKAEAVSAQFKDNPDSERLAINKWVSEQTMDKIKDLLAPGVIDPLTRMVLVNAIYFKGQWLDQFDTNNTMPRPFKISPSETKQVPTMFAAKKYAFTSSEALNCKALEIPYKGNELSMVILLPNDDFGLETLISKLTEDNLKSVLTSLGEPHQKVDLTLPKFEVTSALSLKEHLSSMGMRDAFSDTNANLTGIAAGRNELYVSAVVHKAFVKVNEEGTEAAAATAVIMRKKCRRMPNPKFMADHPFLFVIRDKHSENSNFLFGGAIVNPG